LHWPVNDTLALALRKAAGHSLALEDVISCDLAEGMAYLCLRDVDGLAAMAPSALILSNDTAGMAL